MFLDLPPNVQQLIYNQLDVCDRAKLAIALQKIENANKVIKYKDKTSEKKLGILSKSIVKKRVVKLSETMMEFLTKSVDPSDSTLGVIAESFPIVNTIINKTHVKSIAERITEGIVSKEFLDELRNENNDEMLNLSNGSFDRSWRFLTSAYGCSVDMFKMLMCVESVSLWVADFNYYFVCNVFEALNADLIDYIFNCHPFPLELTGLRLMLTEWVFVAWPPIDVIRLYLQYVQFEEHQLQSMWLFYIGQMDTDCAEMIEEFMVKHD